MLLSCGAHSGTGHHEEHFCEIILNLNQWLRRCPFKDISHLDTGGPFVGWSPNICVILVEGIMNNSPVKLF